MIRSADPDNCINAFSGVNAILSMRLIFAICFNFCCTNGSDYDTCNIAMSHLMSHRGDGEATGSQEIPLLRLRMRKNDLSVITQFVDRPRR